MKTFYVNARYLIVPLMTIATIFGIFLGNNFVWLGVILFGFNTIIDTLTKDIHLRADFDEDGNSFGIKKFQYAVMYLMLPTFIVLQIILAWRLFHYTSAYPIEVTSLFGITYFFTSTTTYEMADYIGKKGYSILTLLSVIYFFLMYYLSVLVGTARFARSSVLFANKLPGNL